MKLRHLCCQSPVDGVCSQVSVDWHFRPVSGGWRVDEDREGLERLIKESVIWPIHHVWCCISMTMSTTLMQCMWSSDWASSQRAFSLPRSALISTSSCFNMVSAWCSAAFWFSSITSISSAWDRSIADPSAANREMLLAISCSTATWEIRNIISLGKFLIKLKKRLSKNILNYYKIWLNRLYVEVSWISYHKMYRNTVLSIRYKSRKINRRIFYKTGLSQFKKSSITQKEP